MFEITFFLIYFCLITSLQSAIGVGILVLGTPFLLLLEYNIVDIFFTLLPLSIITSLANLIIIKFYNKRTKISSIKEIKQFFIICIPSIIIGLLILKLFQNYLNIKFLVSLVIILSILIVTFNKKIKFKINFFRKSILSVIGIIHGLTNSGGTLMSLVISSNNNRNFARLNITFFYLILAVFQYLITIIMFYENFKIPFDIDMIFTIFIGIFIGNFFYHHINEKKYKIFVNFLAAISAIFLIIF